jgi:hypothetical protein
MAEEKKEKKTGRPIKRSLDQVLKAIKGSDGVKRVIADKLRVCRNTLDNYLREWATAQKAYDAECEGLLDIAESVVVNNIKIALNQQMREQAEAKADPNVKPLQVDSGDAKWYLSMKGAKRGYKKTSTHEIEQETGIVLKLGNPLINDEDFRQDLLNELKEGDE